MCFIRKRTEINIETRLGKVHLKGKLTQNIQNSICTKFFHHAMS